MTLPIIIIPERHWDPFVKQAVLTSLPILKQYGYDTLCFESAHDLAATDIETGVKTTIDFIEGQLKLACQYLENRGINPDNLCQQDYTYLSRLLRLYVSSQYYQEMAIWFRELPGLKEKLKLIQHAKDSYNFDIKGIDLITSRLAPLQSREAQINIGLKKALVRELDNERITSFTHQLINLQTSGKGVIFVMGQLHTDALFKAFSDLHYEKELLYVHPYHKQFLDKTLADTHLHIANTKILALDMAIESNEDLEVFDKKLETTLSTTLSRFYKAIPETTSTFKLTKKTGLTFFAYQRPSYYVDCMATGKKQDLTVIHQSLEKNSIPSNLTLFKSKQVLCVPCTNDSDIAKKLLF